ncbi:helix-turn-helix transcriptional regulator [Streptomyces sp. NA04227]|uniref:helix-turn-helix domain-containing protein n=1 Tax=Streptomyces sp. NA04227 TaxID=2742136 RepID=UPI00158FF6DB|nr:helix-turn-helix transcriptional regulator [Streptomyces sp. NA04227]QKW08023.1 helix-turn-helix transcriptional regulator [Streptomyces sp. NA04227]
MEQQGWPERLAATIAHEVRRYRLNLRMSAQQLSDRCTELGMEIPRAVISNLENGRRTSVTVAELLVLAAALDVPPAVLAFPVGYTEQTEALPAAPTPPFEAVRWFAGEEQSATPGTAAQGRAAALQHLAWRTEGHGGEALSGYRKADRTAEEGLKHADRADRMRADAYDVDDTATRDALAHAAHKQAEQAEHARTRLQRVLETLDELGATVPPKTMHVALFQQTTRGTPPRAKRTKGK